MSRADDAPTIICPVSVEGLAAAAQPGAPMDAGSRKLLDQELKTLECRRKQHELELPHAERDRNGDVLRTNLTGLALSGGGIRSATFCLGVLQALAKADLLKRFDYLSTVSGGGYIGSSLTWWLSGRWQTAAAPGTAFEFGVEQDTFPYGVGSAINVNPAARPMQAKEAGPRLLNYLRKHGNYLTPGNGINILSGISVGVRAIFLNLFAWIPLVTLVFLLLYWLPRILFPYSTVALQDPSSSDSTPAPELICSGSAGIGSCLSDILRRDAAFIWNSIFPSGQSIDTNPSSFYVIFLDSVWISVIFTIAAVLYYCVVRLRKRSGRYWDRKGVWVWVCAWWLWLPIIAILAIAVLLSTPPELPSDFQKYWLIILAGILASTYGLLCLVYSFATYIVAKLKLGHEFGYMMRRLFESWAGVYLSVLLGLSVIGSVPLVADWLQAPPEQIAAADGAQGEPAAAGVGGGILALLAGLATTIAAFLRSGAKVGTSLRARGWHVSGGFTATLAAALLLFGVLLLSYQATVAIRAGYINPQVAFWVLVAAVASVFLVNINNISLGRFYRDRLMEAFMPGYEAALDERTDAAPQAAERMRLTEASPAAPYHIVNTNVVLIGAKDRRRRIRGGDSFILTRDYCGSNATGWRRTATFIKGKMTLPSALAISGAAANPNTGVGGVGLTRSRVVSVLMALVNLRLGYWAPHPTKQRRQNVTPNHFHPGLTALIMGHHESSGFQELTDGGHFENLGIYELIRRRVRLILVCDAGQDADFGLQDLQVALHRIEEDFGARVEFGMRRQSSANLGLHESEAKFGSEESGVELRLEEYPIEDLIPEKATRTYPRKLKLAQHGFAVGDLYYASDLDAQGEPRREVEPARIVYIKSTIIDQLPLDLRGYKARESAFPDQSTGDQFFDEDQFEAYRDLGQRLAEAMLEDDELRCDLLRRLPNDLGNVAAKPR